MALELVCIACAVSAVSGLPGLLLPRRSAVGQIIAVTLLVAGCGAGAIAAIAAMTTGATESMLLPGVLPEWGFHLRLDALSGFFLAPIFVVGGLGSIYGLRYWRQTEHPRTGAGLTLLYGLLVAGLAMVTLAGDGLTFLFAWEIMAISGFFLVSTEDRKPQTRRAGWLYLLATHAGTLALFAAFALLRYAAGTLELRRLQPVEAGAGLQVVIFLLGLLGFGMKAGMMPLHFWLPSAHASAPSHVSAVLSGVLLKIGIYGLVRMATLLPNLPVACGILVLAIGTVSAVLGVAFALGQHDLKRLLAYHSIENIGIILMGLGLAVTGSAAGRPDWMMLGLAGCLLHVWNHGLFKSLLFLSAGSVVHASRTREIDCLGGLSKSMPRTAALFAVGAVAICGLPPLNGFVSELIIYLGLFGAAREGQSGLSAVALAAPALAMVGALAVACFVKAYGAVFLGTARTHHAARADESPATMIGPMAVLAALCVFIGLVPIAALRAMGPALAVWPGAGGRRVEELVPCGLITTMGICLIAAVGAVLLWLGRRRALRPAGEGPTWDCGYVRSRPTIQYTASSFAGTLVGLFRWVLHPQAHAKRPRGLFPEGAGFESHVPDIVLDGVLGPLWLSIKSRLATVRMLQQGRVQRYLLYILLALFGLLLSLVPVAGLARKLLGR